MKDNFEQELNRMVELQIAARGIKNPKVLAAFRKVPRHLFIPEQFRGFAFDDGPVSIGEGQTISQPYIVAYMTNLLEIKENDKVLEIGTGSGYQTAILAELANQVYTVEVRKSLAERARKILTDLGYTNIKYRIGDGYDGWPEFAPYDKIIVTAAPPEIPEKLVEQLGNDGIMVVPVGKGMVQYIYRIKKKENSIEKERLLPVRFVEMIKGKS